MVLHWKLIEKLHFSFLSGFLVVQIYSFITGSRNQQVCILWFNVQTVFVGPFCISTIGMDGVLISK